MTDVTPLAHTFTAPDGSVHCRCGLAEAAARSETPRDGQRCSWPYSNCRARSETPELQELRDRLALYEKMENPDWRGLALAALAAPTTEGAGLLEAVQDLTADFYTEAEQDAWQTAINQVVRLIDRTARSRLHVPWPDEMTDETRCLTCGANLAEPCAQQPILAIEAEAAARSETDVTPLSGCTEHRDNPRVTGPFQCAACITAARSETPGLREAAQSVHDSWFGGDLDNNYDRIASAFDSLRDALAAPTTEGLDGNPTLNGEDMKVAAEYARLGRLVRKAEEYIEAVTSYLDESNQFTHSRRHHLDRTGEELAELVAASLTEPES